MKSIHTPIRVHLDDQGRPRAWCWDGQVWRVLRILDRWVLQARWWTGGHERRDYLLVETTAAPVSRAGPEDGEAADGPVPKPASVPCAVEIYRRRRGGGCGNDHDIWILARILT